MNETGDRAKHSSRYIPRPPSIWLIARPNWVGEYRRSGRRRRDAERIIVEAKRIEGEDFAISPRSLQLWLKAYNSVDQAGDIVGVKALIDGRAIATSAADPQCRATATRSPEAVAFFYVLYHTQAGHDIQKCHDATLEEARRCGWSWPETSSATAQWLRHHDDLATSCLHREGPGA